MTRDRLSQNPRVSRWILVVGAIVHFAMCWPLYGRRGYPKADPFWLAMIWLWVPAVIGSAIYVKWSRKRLRDLALYGLATAFTVSWASIDVVPSHKTPRHAFADLTFVLPIMCVGLLIVECLSRTVLRRMRAFLPPGACERCGYHLHGLAEPRCPECGEPFPRGLLDPGLQTPPEPEIRQRITVLIAVLLVLVCTFPFAYRAGTFYSYRARGRAAGEGDWANGAAIWHVTRAEMDVMTEVQEGNYFLTQFRLDEKSGFIIEPMRHDWEHRCWQSAYREAIEQKLREAGRSPPTFD